jgi:hypothetical protein
MPRQHCSLSLPQNFTITSGENSITCYRDLATDSSIPLMRNFCKICGSKVFATTQLREDIVSISAGTLQNAGQDWVPVKEQYCKYVRTPRDNILSLFQSLLAMSRVATAPETCAFWSAYIRTLTIVGLLMFLRPLPKLCMSSADLGV